MFDRIIEQTAGRFGLSTEKTKQLLGALIALIFNEKRGGPAGFLHAFRSHGLGDVVGSWLSGGPRQPISAGQLDNVLGAGTLGGLAAKLGLPADTVGNAAAALLPEAVGELGENGQLPTSMPDRFKGWLGGLGDFLGDIGGWGTAAVGAGAAAVGAGVGKIGDLAGDSARAVGAGVDRVGDAAGAGVRAVGAGLNKGVDAIGSGVGSVKSGRGKLWPWLLLAALAISAFLLLRGCKGDETANPLEQAAQGASDAAGTVAGAAGDAVDATANAAGNAADAAANAAGSAVDAAGDAAAAAGDAAGAAVERSADAANAALDKLANAGAQTSVDDLIKALNLMPINFETASARITADSDAILQKAAAAIKAAPAGTRIEVGGHTDSDGNDAANQSLSEARAAAVVARLGELGVAAGTLSSKGYGEGSPIADNATAEGKARNRRIEFKVSP